MRVEYLISCFGVGAIAAAGVAFINATAYGWQMGVFVLVSAIAVALTRSFADRVSGKQIENFGVDRLPGQSGVVVQAIDPTTGSGRVRVSREEWRADSANMDAIEVGCMIEVINIDGTHLVVQRRTQQ